MAAVQPLKMTLLGKVDDPSVACKPGTGTLVKKLVDGRPVAAAAAPHEAPAPSKPTEFQLREIDGASAGWCRWPVRVGMVFAIWALYFRFRRRGPLTLQVECGCSPTCAWMPYFKLTEVEK